MRPELFYPTPLGEARLLLLIDAFSGTQRGLEGRTKLAKLDFFLRYPHYLQRALLILGASEPQVAPEEVDNIEARMVRYRFGPWDPSYFGILGCLIGRSLVEPIRTSRGVSYRVTPSGHELASRMAEEPTWIETNERIRLIKRHLDRSGTWLKDFVYENFPEVAKARMGESL